MSLFDGQQSVPGFQETNTLSNLRSIELGSPGKPRRLSVIVEIDTTKKRTSKSNSPLSSLSGNPATEGSSTSKATQRRADKNLFHKEIEDLLKEDDDDDDDILNISFAVTPHTVRRCVAVRSRIQGAPMLIMVPNSADPFFSEPRRSSRMKRDVSYAPPPLDPFQDHQLLAQADQPSPGSRSFEVSSRVTPSKKPKYDLETLLKGKKKHEERMRRYREIGDIVRELVWFVVQEHIRAEFEHAET